MAIHVQGLHFAYEVDATKAMNYIYQKQSPPKRASQKKLFWPIKSIWAAVTAFSYINTNVAAVHMK